ncbi:MAG: tetraacyldisaccharide 4'-kinase [Sulfurimonas sp. RIFOXYD12_FULL_33_39]|uniref:tetraacyldisaccharide 4'-kinase n=1 Tax=unclassified Sulfurimonas TaxID=2623549 RepID=UPI0008D216A1|nr:MULTISPECIES: tetraacyldisaccharide 4'-kinase [unclassified Sulfurimonas]OHE08883.1 MAG: tetraacyldisaccharide 4'-kinase [Sulfurimonas sp. RIFOXYD12_FULL_33_39]OHE14193.1 MAG: tetraacyldisaccharide 4'-kinase [Sulfurimonas sp. RIFOXYD2_FULL_34_21]DAB28175.1 MAG TPA: tetraacyldisaccharide 4'-kinase [Sulfurimonas sp. UBA10385]
MKKVVFWVEEYFYNPTLTQKLLSFFLLPLSLIYCFYMYIRFKSKKVEDFGIDIISVGNLNVGGSGKTPLVSALASRYKDVAVILRGYGRKSSGLFVVSDGSRILCDVNISGDEAMVYARKLPHVKVIVSEDRKKGINKAKELGAKIIFLDDAYSKHDIKKLDILINVQSKNGFCLPSGPFRERLWTTKEVVVLRDEEDFKRVVELKNKSDKMSLVTAIARPQRLDGYLPDVISKNYFEDHHSFTKKEIEDILQRDGSDSILVTYKDFVKLEQFGLKLSLLDLHVEVNENIFKIIDDYRGRNSAKKD